MRGDGPVYGDDCGIESESGMAVAILAPYRVSRVLAFVGSFEGVVDTRDDDEKVREYRRDSVGDYSASGILISSLKWIDFTLLATVSGALRLLPASLEW